MGEGWGCGVGVGVGVGKPGKFQLGKLQVGNVQSKPAATSGCWLLWVEAELLEEGEVVMLASSRRARARERRPWAILGLRAPRYSLENCFGLRCENRLPEALRPAAQAEVGSAQQHYLQNLGLAMIVGSETRGSAACNEKSALALLQLLGFVQFELSPPGHFGVQVDGQDVCHVVPEVAERHLQTPDGQPTLVSEAKFFTNQPAAAAILATLLVRLTMSVGCASMKVLHQSANMALSFCIGSWPHSNWLRRLMQTDSRLPATNLSTRALCLSVCPHLAADCSRHVHRCAHRRWTARVGGHWHAQALCEHLGLYHGLGLGSCIKVPAGIPSRSR